MEKTNKPLAAHLEFKERLEELFSQAPKGFGYMCFYYTTDGKDLSGVGCFGDGKQPILANAIVETMWDNERVNDLIQTASSFIAELEQNKNSHDKS